ncbi:MAG: DNA cytosine methyltransferase, partial [Candidatus Acidiferrales bacterium]
HNLWHDSCLATGVMEPTDALMKSKCELRRRPFLVGHKARKEMQILLPGIGRAAENPWQTRSQPSEIAFPQIGTGISTLELCAGAGGQALGYETAGFHHAALVEIDRSACETLKMNRPQWSTLCEDLRTFHAKTYRGIDVVSAGLPCPPFSVAGKQLGRKDDRNLFPSLIRIVDETRPRIVAIENVRGILDAVFDDYRQYVGRELSKLGYQSGWKLMNACDFGVPQLRPRVVFVAIKANSAEHFSWPAETNVPTRTVGEVLYDLIAENGWRAAKAWRAQANEVAPTIVGGSLKHGGPDLGPTRSRAAWATLGVDGLGIADGAPPRDFVGMPRLTVRMVARLQGFPDTWHFFGKKTQAYRQVGNAFPPPFAHAVARCIAACLSASMKRTRVAV